jgi:membrane-associated protein
VWSLGVIVAGYLLGSHIGNVDHYLLPIIAVIIVGSLIPIAVELRRTDRV